MCPDHSHFCVCTGDTEELGVAWGLAMSLTTPYRATPSIMPLFCFLGIEQASVGGHNVQHTRPSGDIVSDPVAGGGLPFLQPSGQGTTPKLPLLSQKQQKPSGEIDNSVNFVGTCTVEFGILIIVIASILLHVH